MAQLNIDNPTQSLVVGQGWFFRVTIDWIGLEVSQIGWEKSDTPNGPIAHKLPKLYLANKHVVFVGRTKRETLNTTTQEEAKVE